MKGELQRCLAPEIKDLVRIGGKGFTLSLTDAPMLDVELALRKSKCR